MFELGKAMDEWKVRLGERGVGGEDALELESHLMDEVNALQERELSLEEAFLVASRRVGPIEGLAREYAKVHPWATWRVPVYWMAVGVLLAVAGAGAISVVTQLGLLAGADAQVGAAGLHAATIIVNLIGPVLLLAGLGFAFTRIPRTLCSWAGPALAALAVGVLPLGLVYTPLWRRVAQAIHPRVLWQVQLTWMLSSSLFLGLVVLTMVALVVRLRRHSLG